MDPTMKSCPDCAEEVRAEARKCRYCGYQFEFAQMGTSGSEPSDQPAISNRDTQEDPLAPAQRIPSADSSGGSRPPSPPPSGRDDQPFWRRPGVVVAVAACALVALVAGIVFTSNGNATTVRDSVYPSSADALQQAGITPDSGGLWIFDVTCGQIENYPGILHPMVVEGAEDINTPLGKQAAIDALTHAIPRVCQGVSPDYQPEEDAENVAGQETGAS